MLKVIKQECHILANNNWGGVSIIIYANKNSLNNCIIEYLLPL